jgi:hypothetical protein
MEKIEPKRTTIGIVDRIEPNGTVFVHEIDTQKMGFLGNTTPVVGNVHLKPGTKLSIDVVDQGNVMVVASARFIAG